MDYITARQAAEKWGLSLRQVQNLLKKGHVEGAVRFGRDYMIPKSANKPEDRRTAEYRGSLNKDSDTPEIK